MAYYYDMKWHDYPPNYEEWLKSTGKSREIGAKVLVTDKLAEHIKTQKKLLKSMAEKLSYSFCEVLYSSGQRRLREFETVQERDACLRAMEYTFLHNSEPEPTLQKYIYMLYHKALYDYAERVKWETKGPRTKHRDWATNTREYKTLEDKYERLLEDHEELQRDYGGLLDNRK